jgi:hypothetical protein
MSTKFVLTWKKNREVMSPPGIWKQVKTGTIMKGDLYCNGSTYEFTEVEDNYIGTSVVGYGLLIRKVD